MAVAQVIVDVATRQLDTPFDYLVPEELGEVGVGHCVLVDFANRPVVGYVVGVTDHSDFPRLKPLRAVLGAGYFGEYAPALAHWISDTYLCPLSEALRLFMPPGGAPRAVRSKTGDWELRRAGAGPVDDRWIRLPDQPSDFVPGTRATMQRAVLEALTAGPCRAAELAADLGSIDGALKRLEVAGAVVVERRRRFRDPLVREKAAPRHTELTAGQADALQAISEALEARAGGVIVVDGVTGSGKTEVYLQAIEAVRLSGGTACVLVPEISLTPQTVGRFRSRFGGEVAVLHSRLSAGERYDQWDLTRRGEASVVVGARSAIFAPLSDLRLIVIDEEHESSYKQSSAPRYHARDVAAQMAKLTGAVVVLGSASPSMESRHRCDTGEWKRVALPARVTGRPLPPVTVVDMAAEFEAGHRSMFSRPLIAALQQVAAAGSKAVLFLNRRGFASFLLCRECGFVPECEECAVSLTYHEVGTRLQCHHCGAVHPVPAVCPRCSSPYLRQFGAGTQRVESDLAGIVEGLPIVRMDADTTRGKGGHEKALLAFEALESGILLGTQMIAKGLDYPEVTLVGVINADTTLHMPDFRAGERTYQLLEQVAGRAGRGSDEGRVIVQTYWPDHPAIRAAAAHDPSVFYTQEASERTELGYPPFGRLVNVLIWGKDAGVVADFAARVAASLESSLPVGSSILGPSPAPISRIKGVWRWHVLVKAPEGAAVSGVVSHALGALKSPAEVTVTADVDPLDLL
ncbi:MAG: primosomal protein N' [Coriobacteriia bacterium]|nr:primosomal protein N' [Coriobacteriia bacterium]